MGSTFTVRVDDPRQAGASIPVRESSTQAFMSIYPISHGKAGSTTVTVTDASGASAKIAVSQQACGRPDALAIAQLYYPLAAKRHVPPSIGSVFLNVYYNALPSPAPTPLTRLHLIVGTSGTLEAGPLRDATPPPGAIAPTPIPGPFVIRTMKADVPALPAQSAIRVQVYDDNCQPPVPSENGGKFFTN